MVHHSNPHWVDYIQLLLQPSTPTGSSHAHMLALTPHTLATTVCVCVCVCSNPARIHHIISYRVLQLKNHTICINGAACDINLLKKVGGRGSLQWYATLLSKVFISTYLRLIKDDERLTRCSPPPNSLNKPHTNTHT